MYTYMETCINANTEYTHILGQLQRNSRKPIRPIIHIYQRKATPRGLIYSNGGCNTYAFSRLFFKFRSEPESKKTINLNTHLVTKKKLRTEENILL